MLGPNRLTGPRDLLEIIKNQREAAKPAESNKKPLEATAEPEPQDLSYLLDPHEFLEPVIEEEPSPYLIIRGDSPTEFLKELFYPRDSFWEPHRIYFTPKNSKTKIYLNEEDLRTLAEIQQYETLSLADLGDIGDENMRENIESRLIILGLIENVDNIILGYALSDLLLTGNMLPNGR